MRKRWNTLRRDLFEGFLVFLLVIYILLIAFGIIGAALGQETEPNEGQNSDTRNVGGRKCQGIESTGSLSLWFSVARC